MAAEVKPVITLDLLDQIDIRAVSYTHLDVYKRQALKICQKWLRRILIYIIEE